MAGVSKSVPLRTTSPGCSQTVSRKGQDSKNVYIAQTTAEPKIL